MDNKLGKFLYDLRKKKGLTQQELADRLHISDKSISRWEKGVNFPSVEMLHTISELFGVKFNYLLSLRVEDNALDTDDTKEIIKELNGINGRKIRRLRLFTIISSILVVLSIGGLLFTRSYNRFKVYRVYASNDYFAFNYGIYVETRIKDILYLGNLDLVNVETSKDDEIYAELIFKKNGKDQIIHKFSAIKDLYFKLSDSYIKIDDLSNHFNKIYIKVVVTNDKGEKKEYEAKLKFVKDFSNNKIFPDDNNEYLDYSDITLTTDEIKKILEKNGFKKIENIYVKSIDDYKILYYYDSNKIMLRFFKDNLDYKYTYFVSSNDIEVLITNNENIEIENYFYDLNSRKVTCITGNCNCYDEALKTLNEKILYLLKEEK